MRGEITTATIIGMILLVISFLVVFNLAIQFGEKADKGYNQELCRTSVVANAKLNVPLFGDGAWPIKCPTRYHYFDTEGFIEESGDFKKEFKYSTKTKDLDFEIREYAACMNDKSVNAADGLTKEDICILRNMNWIIAQRHAECWEQFGRGELSMFDRLDTERQCVICSVYDFSDDLEKKFGANYLSSMVSEKNTLDYYMRTKGPMGRNITYYELTLDSMDVFQEPYFDYSFDESYASVFIANNDDYIQTKLKELGQTFNDPIHTLLPFLSVGPEDDKKFFLNTNEFVPESMVVRECDVLVEQ